MHAPHKPVMQALQEDLMSQGQESWRIVTMFVLPESKTNVTELFTVADFHSVVIKLQYPVQIQRRILRFEDNFRLLKIIKHDFSVN